MVFCDYLRNYSVYLLFNRRNYSSFSRIYTQLFNIVVILHYGMRFLQIIKKELCFFIRCGYGVDKHRCDDTFSQYIIPRADSYSIKKIICGKMVV